MCFFFPALNSHLLIELSIEGHMAKAFFKIVSTLILFLFSTPLNWLDVCVREKQWNLDIFKNSFDLKAPEGHRGPSRFCRSLYRLVPLLLLLILTFLFPFYSEWWAASSLTLPDNPDILTPTAASGSFSFPSQQLHLPRCTLTCCKVMPKHFGWERFLYSSTDFFLLWLLHRIAELIYFVFGVGRSKWKDSK